MLRLSCLLVLVVAAVSCVLPSRTLRQNEALAPAEPEGYIALVTDIPATANVLASLCQNGDLGRCVTVGPQRNDDGVRLIAVPPGRYCVGELAFDNGMQSMHLQVEPEFMKCFDVAADTIAYPGHFAVRIVDLESATSFVSYDFAAVAGVEERTRSTYPLTSAVPFNTVEVQLLKATSAR